MMERCCDDCVHYNTFYHSSERGAMAIINRESIVSFGLSESTNHETYIFVKALEKSGVCTPYFQSFSDRIDVIIYGSVGSGSNIGYTIYFYDEDGVEKEICSQQILISPENTFEMSYSFDPVSLGVYQNATNFRVMLYAVSEMAEIYIHEFSVQEKGVLQKDGEADIHRKTISSAEYKKCLSVSAPQKVLFVGNSILLGMFNTYGMCATSPQKDYAYLIQQEILKHNSECIFYKLHGAGVEHAESIEMFEAWFDQDANQYTGRLAKESFMEDLDMILIQLGDNINTEAKKAAFEKNGDVFIGLIKKLSPKARIIWVSGWFRKDNRNIIGELCRRWKIEHVDISDLTGMENQALSGQISWHPEEGAYMVKDIWITHPGDKGMQEIAKRILKTIGL